MKLLLKSAFTVIAIMLLAFSAVFYITWISSVKTLEVQAEGLLEKLAVQTMDKIDRAIFERQANMQSLAADTIISSRDSSPRQITERLIKFRNIYKAYLSLSFFDLNRVRIANTAGLHLGIQHDMKKYWKDVLQGKLSIASDIRYSEVSGSNIIYFAAPVKDKDGRPFGVVVAKMPVGKLYEIVGRLGSIENIQIDLVNRDGLLIYSNYNRKGILKETLTDWKTVKDMCLGEYAGVITEHWHLGKEKRILSFCRERGHLDYEGNDWTLILSIPTRVVFAPLVAVRNKWLLVIVPGIILAIIAALIFSFRFSAPLSSLRDAFIDVGKGKLDTRVKIESRDEVEELGNAFNRMAENLQVTTTSIDDLEQEINVSREMKTAMQAAYIEKEHSELEARRLLKDKEVLLNEVHTIATTLEEKVKARTSELSVFYNVANAISYTPDLQKMINLVMKSLFSVLPFDMCASLILDGEKASIFLQPAQPESVVFADEVKKNITNAVSVLSGKDVAAKRLSTHLLPVHSDPDPGTAGKKRFGGLKSFFNVPFIEQGKIVGMIHVSSRDEDVFNEDNVKLIYAIANHASTAIERLRTVIKAEKSKIESVVDSMSDGVFMIDKQGETVVINPQAKRMMGFLPEEKNIDLVLIDKMKEVDLYATFLVCRSADKEFFKDIVISGKEENNYRCSLSPVRDAEGKHIGVVIVLIDVTKEHKIDRMKTEFVSTVSHELRTPLTTIREAVSQVIDGILGGINEKQHEFLSIALEDIDRLKRIIDNILDISKIESGKVRIKRDITDIVSLTQGIKEQFAKRFQAKKVDIKAKYSNDKIDISIDKDRIIQVFSNLLNNALKFTEKGYIEISVIDKENEVECAVTDTGKGFSKEDLKKVFRKFEQFGRVPGSGEKGTGLGLSIAEGIVRLHNGKITVESELNKGTKFTFILPKLSEKEMLRECIENKINESKKDSMEFAVFIFNLDGYPASLEKYDPDTVSSFFSVCREALKKTTRSEDVYALRKSGRIIVTADVSGNDAQMIIKRLRAVFKSTAFDTFDGEDILFSYGFVTYPGSGNTADGLLSKVEKVLVSEQEERSKKQIMIVDDELEVIDILTKMLKKTGYTRLPQACLGQDALKQASEDIPDLLILDIRLPDINGYEVIGRLKENMKTKDIPIVIVSGHEVEKKKLLEFAKTKPMPVLAKPINYEDFIKIVNYLL